MCGLLAYKDESHERSDAGKSIQHPSLLCIGSKRFHNFAPASHPPGRLVDPITAGLYTSCPSHHCTSSPCHYCKPPAPLIVTTSATLIPATGVPLA
eukprot:scaffold9962_cov17-Tisochrysis_lutea.AAC.1